MPDYDALLSRQRNVLLGSQEPTTREAIRAGIQSTTGTPYAQNLSNITAERYNRALGGYQVLSNERDFQARREQQLWQRAQAEADRGDENFKRLLELSGAYGANAADAQRLAAWAIQQAEERNVDDPNMVPSLVAEGAEALGLPARPELTLMSTAGGGVTGIDPLGGTRTIVEGAVDAPKPYTDIGKLNSDLNAGLVTPAQALQEAQRLNSDGDETWRPMTPEERTQYGIPEGRAAQISSQGKAGVIGSSSGGITLYGPEGNILAQVGGVPLTESQTGKQGIEIADAIRESERRLSELSNALRSLRETPEAAGISGQVIENIGGYAQQITDLAGIDGDWLPTAEVQRVRTELASLLGQYIPTITGDDSGRYSDRDMDRARAALPATNARAGFPVVESALLTLQDVEQRSRARRLMRADGFDPRIDITYAEGQTRYIAKLLDEGKSPQEVADIMTDLLQKYEIPLEVRGIQ